jgi:hypothetical protein
MLGPRRSGTLSSVIDRQIGPLTSAPQGAKVSETGAAMKRPTGSGTHERLHREERATGGSDRSFGLVIGAAFVVVGLWPLLSATPPRVWSLGVAVAFVGAALLRPRLLAPLNWGWTRLGLLMHRVTSPVVLGLVFYTTVTPIGLLLRAMGKDVLGRRWDGSRTTYWIPRVPPGPVGATMRRQF